MGLKKYLGGTLSSKICDKEDAAAALGYSEVLRVQSSPRDVTRPEFSKGQEDAHEISSIVTGKKAGDVFEQDKSRFEFIHDSRCFVEKTASLSGKPCSLPSDGEVLTGPSSADDIDSLKVVPPYVFDIAVPLNVGPVSGQHLLTAVAVYFDLPLDGKPSAFHRQIEAT